MTVSAILNCNPTCCTKYEYGWNCFHGWCRARSSKPLSRMEIMWLVGSIPMHFRHFALPPLRLGISNGQIHHCLLVLRVRNSVSCICSSFGSGSSPTPRICRRLTQDTDRITGRGAGPAAATYCALPAGPSRSAFRPQSESESAAQTCSAAKEGHRHSGNAAVSQILG